MHGWDVQPRHSQNRAFSAFRCCAAALLRLQDAMLIKWRSFHASMQIDSHASMKSVHKDAWLGRSAAPFAKSRFQRFPLLRSSFLLIKWRSFHASMQADSHASMKSAYKDAWLNWELHKFLSCTFCKNIVKCS